MAAGARRIVVIGVGNPDRGDDGAGRAVARRLRGHLQNDVQVIDLNGETTDLLEALEGVAAAYLIDAGVSGSAPGTVRRFDVSSAPLPADALAASTHGLGLAHAVELARALGQLPPRCIVFAIEGESFEIGAPMSAAVERAADALAEELRRALAEEACHA